MRKFLILAVISVFAIPLSSIIPLRGQPIWYPQYLGLFFVMLLGVSLFLWNFNKWLSLFTIICLFSTFFITKLSPRAIMLLVQLDLGCLASYGISKFNQGQRKKILYAIIGFMFLQGVWLLLQKFNLDPIFSSLANKNLDNMDAFSGSKDQLGTYFALIFPIVLYLTPALFIIPLIGLFIAKSSFAFIAAFISVSLYYWFIDKKMAVKIILLALIISGLFFIQFEKLKPADFSTRLAVWKKAIVSTIKGEVYVQDLNKETIVTTNPLFGYGFGNFQRVFPYIPQEQNFNYVDEKFNHAHNDPIELFFELGWSGLIVLIGLIGSFIFGFIKSTKDKELIVYFCCLIASLFNSMGNFLSQIAVSGAFLILFFGMYQGRRREIGTTAFVG